MRAIWRDVFEFVGVYVLAHSTIVLLLINTGTPTHLNTT
jgi:hypothetical protein